MRLSDRIFLAFYIILLLVAAATIMIYPIFPSLDGPEHLFYAETLQKLRQGHEFYSRNIQLDDRILPNGAFDELTGALSNFLSPVEAQKTMLFLSYLLLNISFLLILSHYSKDKKIILGLSSLFVPLSYTFCLVMGFFNFYLSLAFLLLSFYLFNKAIESRSIALFIALIVSTFMIYLSHLIAWLIYCLLMGLFIAYDIAKARFFDRKKIDFKPLKVFLLSAGIPLLLSISYIFTLVSSRLDYIGGPGALMEDVSKTLQDRIIYSFETVAYGYTTHFITLFICGALLALLLLKIRRMRSYKLLAMTACFLVVFSLLPTLILGWYYLKQRFWIPTLALFLLMFTQINLKRWQKTAFVIFCIALSILLMGYTELEIRENYLSTKDVYSGMMNISIKGNSTVLSFYSSGSMNWHIIGYYCIVHDCLFQYTWFREPDTFQAKQTTKMPGPSDGYQLDETYLVYDYYFFEGPYYANITNVTSRLNLTPVYISKEWRVFSYDWRTKEYKSDNRTMLSKEKFK